MINNFPEKFPIICCRTNYTSCLKTVFVVPLFSYLSSICLTPGLYYAEFSVYAAVHHYSLVYKYNLIIFCLVGCKLMHFYSLVNIHLYNKALRSYIYICIYVNLYVSNSWPNG